MRKVDFLPIVAAGLLAPLASAQPDPADRTSWSLERKAPPVETLGAPPDLPIHLILDDGSHETDIGFGTNTAFQFLWLNRFESPSSAFDLKEIHVLFPADPEIVPGAAVQLVVYRDPDGDPTTGAELVAAIDESIEVADGVSFSVYPLDPPVRLLGAGDVLIGVVNRFVESGVSPVSRPAALDGTDSAGRSWVALWTGDPPDPPVLPPDLFIDTIDFLEPGNWMIRGFGAPVPLVEIPTLDSIGLAGLALLLGLTGLVLLRRRLG